MRFTALACIVGSLLTLTLCCAGASAKELSADARKAAEDSNQFAVSLFGRLAGDSKENLFLSPYSIETALAMTYAGAAGETSRQMAQTLHFDLPPEKLHAAFGALASALDDQGAGNDRAFDLTVANALWIQQGFDINPAFTDVVKKAYRAQLGSLDFAASDTSREEARKSVNQWVEQQTHDKIKDLLPAGSLTSDTRLVLTNAIYFKSNWQTPFEKNQTRDEAFHGSTDSNVPMMHETHRFSYMENDQMQAVELPYRRNRLSMLVLLPRKAGGLAELTRSLSVESMQAWSTAMSPREVELSFPKFTFRSHLGLARNLAAMGMPDAFGEKADFSGISTGSRLRVQNVIHQAFIAVDEEGTEAAAATGVTMGAMAIRVPLDPIVFRANHPFLFLIRDNASGAILFMGRVTDPK